MGRGCAIGKFGRAEGAGKADERRTQGLCRKNRTCCSWLRFLKPSMSQMGGLMGGLMIGKLSSLLTTSHLSMGAVKIWDPHLHTTPLMFRIIVYLKS